MGRGEAGKCNGRFARSVHPGRFMVIVLRNSIDIVSCEVFEPLSLDSLRLWQHHILLVCFLYRRQDISPSNTSAAQDTFREFSLSTKQAKHEIQQFRKTMDSAETKEVMDYCNKSREERPKDIRPWMIAEHPDWLEKKKKETWCMMGSGSSEWCTGVI